MSKEPSIPALSVPSTVPTVVVPTEDSNIKKKVVPKSMSEILNTAGKQALKGGIPGAAAMAVQVCSLM